MAELSYNQVFDGVSLALHAVYSTAKIYGDTNRQGLQPGDFVLLPIRADHAAQINVRAQRNITFDLIYFPTGGRDDCLAVADALPEILETIQTPNNDYLHCLKCDCTIDDDVLHCIVSYPHFVYKSITIDKMSTLELDEIVGG